MNRIVFHLTNALAGQSWLLDNIISFTLANELIKSAPIAACFLAAWFRQSDRDEEQERRRRLLITLIAVLLSVATTQLMTRAWLQPRPYVLTQRVYELRGGSLHELPRWQVRQPLDNRARERQSALQAGMIPPDDLRAFPSDHAGLFVCLAVGIFLADRRLGLAAGIWTVALILAGKVMSGMHAPVEILGGVSVALAWLGTVYYLGHVLQRCGADVLRYAAAWSGRHPDLVAGALFLTLFEIAGTFENSKAIVAAIGKHL